MINLIEISNNVNLIDTIVSFTHAKDCKSHFKCR